MCEVVRRTRRAGPRAVVVTVGVLVVTWLAVPAWAAPAEPPGPAPPSESIPTYDVVLTVRSDGVLHVRETITYDFHGAAEHGIVRNVPYRRKNRLYGIEHVRASSSTGAPARARATKFLHDVRISVGDDRRAVRGRQAYVIEYDVSGLFTSSGDYDELRWNALGDSWSVPIGEAAVRVEAAFPFPMRWVSCRAGSAGATTRCLRDRDGPYAVDFTQTDLAPHEEVTIGMRLPRGMVKVAAPRYARPHFIGTWTGVSTMAAGLVAAVSLWRVRPVGLRRGAGALVLAGGLVALVVDTADDMITNGFWAFSMGDPALVGAALMALGGTIMLLGGRNNREEPTVTAGRRT